MPLPKELHIQAGMGQAWIALDEEGNYRDERNWGNVSQKARINNAYHFWARWRSELKTH